MGEREYFGIKDDNFWENTIVRSNEENSIYYVASRIQKLLIKENSALKIVNTGTKIFKKDSGFGKENRSIPYRLSSESTYFLANHFSKMIFTLPFPHFLLLLNAVHVKSDFFDSELLSHFKGVRWGTFIGRVETNFGELFFAMNKNPDSFCLFLNNQEKKAYLDLIESGFLSSSL